MANNWDRYQSYIADKPASVYGNFGLRGHVPKAGLPWLLKVSVQMQSPRDDGLSSREEADALWQLEDALVPAVTERMHAEFIGRITMDGRRDFFFYAPDRHGFEPAVGEALVPFRYEFDTDARHDRDWAFYRDVMYPTPWHWHLIRNRGVLQALMETGDDLSQPRGVHHWIYFASPEDRARFVTAAHAIGFQVREIEVDNRDTPRAWGVQAHRVDSVKPNDIDGVCFELFSLAKQNNGDYDGWETQVVKPGETPADDAPP